MIIKTKINPIKCDCNKFEIKSMSFVSCFDYQINWLIINDNDLAFSNDINLLMFRYVCCFKFTVINEWMNEISWNMLWSELWPNILWPIWMRIRCIEWIQFIFYWQTQSSLIFATICWEYNYESHTSRIVRERRGDINHQSNT